MTNMTPRLPVALSLLVEIFLLEKPRALQLALASPHCRHRLSDSNRVVRFGATLARWHRSLEVPIPVPLRQRCQPLEQ